MKNKLQSLIIEFIKSYSEMKGIQTRWKEPITAFADAQDDMFYALKDL